MNRNIFLYIFLLAIFNGTGVKAGQALGGPLPLKTRQNDTLKENQVLYTGKLWHNKYTMIKGDQFLFSNEYLSASLTMNGQSFRNLSIRYDIYNDEVITPTNNGAILQLNKEMVDSFSIVYGYKTYSFLNTQDDSLSGIKGYVNVLYKGKSALYVKYKKEIDLLAVDDKFDLFFQTYRIYLIKDGIAHPIAIKADLIKILSEYKTQIKEFIKKNKLSFSKKVPESFIPVIRYYDSLSK
jgi:hypothetical protein